MLSTNLSTVLAWGSFGFSILALSIALSARILATRRWRSSKLNARLTAIETDLAEFADSVSKLSKLIRRMNARENMRAHREKKAHDTPFPTESELAPPGPGASDLEKAEWKRQMRLKIARGELK